METLKSLIEGVISISTIPSSQEDLTSSSSSAESSTLALKKIPSTVPTLKFLVSQSLQGLADEQNTKRMSMSKDEVMTPTTPSQIPNQKDQEEEEEQQQQENVDEDLRIRIFPDLSSLLGSPMIQRDRLESDCTKNDKNNNKNDDQQQQHKKSRSRTSGSGDNDSSPQSATAQEYLQSTEIDMTKLLSTAYSTAYEKGSNWLQSGADYIFGDDEKEEQEEEEALSIANSGMTSRHGQSNKLRVDDTAYYNGYGIVVKGQGLKLDTLFLNGSGSSGSPTEIQILLIRDSNPDLGRTPSMIHSSYDREENRLTIKYTHGLMDGVIDVTCPIQVNVNELKNSLNSDHIIITAP